MRPRRWSKSSRKRTSERRHLFRFAAPSASSCCQSTTKNWVHASAASKRLLRGCSSLLIFPTWFLRYSLSSRAQRKCTARSKWTCRLSQTVLFSPRSKPLREGSRISKKECTRTKKMSVEAIRMEVGSPQSSIFTTLGWRMSSANSMVWLARSRDTSRALSVLRNLTRVRTIMLGRRWRLEFSRASYTNNHRLQHCPAPKYAVNFQSIFSKFGQRKRKNRRCQVSSISRSFRKLANRNQWNSTCTNPRARVGCS